MFIYRAGRLWSEPGGPAECCQECACENVCVPVEESACKEAAMSTKAEERQLRAAAVVVVVAVKVGSEA